MPASPVLITVEPAECEDPAKVADADGVCGCDYAKGWTTVAGGNCMQVWALVLVIALPLLFVLLVLGFIYIQVATKMADAIWEIKLEELIFDQPPEVLGRGTFGLVVSASYNTTRVAVKRVIPPKSSGSGSGMASQKGSSLFRHLLSPKRSVPLCFHPALHLAVPPSDELWNPQCDLQRRQTQ